MVIPEALQGIEHAKATNNSDNATSKPLKRLQSNLEVNGKSNRFLPSAVERTSDLRPQRCRSLSPLSNYGPVLATQRSTITMSNDSCRSPSVLEEISTNLLRRYPRFSTATASIDAGQPNFSIEELKSTQLSDDEDGIVNDEPKQDSKGSRALLKQKVAQDVKAMWSSRTSRIRNAGERLKTWPHKPTQQSDDQQLDPAESTGPTVSRPIPSKADEFPVPTLTKTEGASSPQLPEVHFQAASLLPFQEQLYLTTSHHQAESNFTPATVSACGNDPGVREEDPGQGERIAAVVTEDIQKENQAVSERPYLPCAASATQMSSQQLSEDRLLIGRQSFLAPQRANPRMLSMATLETARASAFRQGRCQPQGPSPISTRRDSQSTIGRTSQPASQPSRMRKRSSLSNSVHQLRAEPLFIDTPQDPGTSVVLLPRQVGGPPYNAEGNRPVSHAGSIVSVKAAVHTSTQDVCPLVDLGRSLPQAYEKVPACTIRSMKRNDFSGLNVASLPTLPDSSIAFEEVRDPRHKTSSPQPLPDNVSLASKWAKVQTDVEELQEQDFLLEELAEGAKKENRAVRSCQKIARALSNRIRSDSLPGRFRSRRRKGGNIETTTSGPRGTTITAFLLADK